MGNLTLKDLAYLAITGILVGFSIWEFAKRVGLESEIKRNKAEIKQKEAKIDTLQSKLSKCNSVSNNITIRKIKGKANANLHQFLSPNRTDTLYYVRGYCDTIGIISWYWRQDRRDRLFYERLSKNHNKDP